MGAVLSRQSEHALRIPCASVYAMQGQAGGKRTSPSPRRVGTD